MVMALYLRLSKEDGDLVDESNSITNQRYILHRYLDGIQELSGYQCKEYVDDGYSGRNFERPGVKQLLEDIKANRVYGIAVKDFSRFGRNHIEVGNYIEKIFPLLDIRFIAVNNHFDSAAYIGTTPDMDVSFENLMYDYFSEENSIKIKNDLFHKRMRGKYMAVFAPYGYKKSEKNHNQILVDQEAAEIVRLIFELYAECGVKAEVARRLNDRGIPTPQEYAVLKGVAENWKYKKEKKLWNGSIIGRILRNPIYIGNTVFHKKEVVEAGSKKTKCLPQKEWKICENTHEAIVSKEVFEYVNHFEYVNPLEKRPKQRRVDYKQGEADTGAKSNISYNPAVFCQKERRRSGNKDSPIKGFVKCGGCRHTMNRRNRRNASYYCRHYYEAKAPGCCQENVKEEDLIEIVKNALGRQAMLAAKLRELSELRQNSLKQQKRRLEKAFLRLQGKLHRCRDENFVLYEKYKRGEMSSAEFQELRKRNLKQQETYEKQLKQYEIKAAGKEELKKEELKNEEAEKKDADFVPNSLDILSLPGGREDLTELSRETVEQLISAIYVYGNKQVEIVFQFRDEMANVLGVTNSDIVR